jgi:integrase
MGYGEKRGKGDKAYWRGRYRKPDGGYGTVCHPDGGVRKFEKKRDAARAATAEETAEAETRREAVAQLVSGRLTFADYAGAWFAGQSLDDTTLVTYGGMLRNHLIRYFGEMWLDKITAQLIGEFRDEQREAGYAPKVITNRLALLSEILADAAADPLVQLSLNPAGRRRGRGRRSPERPQDDDTAGDEDDEDEEDEEGDDGMIIASPLRALLIAERASILSGRDDEFILIILGYYTGMRWSEIRGLETRHVEPGRVRILWQLQERDGRNTRKRPKFGKRRAADIPPWLYRLLLTLTRAGAEPCPCHGRTYVFTGHGTSRGGMKTADVAARAGVSPSTASLALRGSGKVAAATAGRVKAAAEEMGWPGRPETPPHLSTSGFATWTWEPAVSGWYPPKKPAPHRPVPVSAEPWPGVPVRGRGNAARADACWVPLAAEVTPHGMRHSHKSLMAELRTHDVMSHDRLGHTMPGIAGVYSHPTPPMRAELMDALTRCWDEALDRRRALRGRSPVAVLDALLSERENPAAGFLSQDSPG